MSVSVYQTPNELLDWTINYATRGLGTDTIASSSWTASSTDFTLSNASNTTTTTTIWVTGGTPGLFYTITNSIVTTGGRDMQETLVYECVAQRIV